MAEKLCTSQMMIHKITPAVDYNYWFMINEVTNQNSIRSPKLLRQPIRKRYYKTLGTSVINSLMSPRSLKFLMWLNISGFNNKSIKCSVQ